MDRNVFFSIVIPSYNGEKYILRCLKSTFAQSYENYEVIIVNDGSTDRTESIINGYIADKPNYRLYTQKNMGLSCARNKGLKVSNGEYIIFLDGDDEIEADTLNRIASEIKEYDLDAVYFDAKIFDESGIENIEESAKYYRPDITSNCVKGEELFIDFMSKNEMLVCACFYAFKRELVENSGLDFYPDIIHEDCLFTVGLLLRCNKVKHIGIQLYKYYINSNSIMTTKSEYREALNYGIVAKELLIHRSDYDLSLHGKRLYEMYCFVMFSLGYSSYKKLKKKDPDVRVLYKNLKKQILKLKIGWRLLELKHRLRCKREE